MTAGIRELKIIILGDAEGAKKMFAETADSGEKAGLSLGKVAAVGAAGVAALGAVAVGIGLKSASAFADVGAQVLKLQRYTGDSAESMSKLRFAAEESGVDIDKFGIGLGKLSKAIESGKLGGLAPTLKETAAQAKALESAQTNLTTAQQKLSDLEAIQHSKATLTVADQIAHRNAVDAVTRAHDALTAAQSTGVKAVAGIGIAFQDAHGKMRPLADVLPEIAEKFKNMPNGIEKNALALQLFGKSGADMLPFLNRGKEGLADLEKEAGKFGQVLNDKQTASVKESIKAHREWHAALEGIQVQIGARVLPILTKLAEFAVSVLLPAIAGIGDVMDRYVGPALAKFGDVVERVFRFIATAIDDFRGGFENPAASIGKSVDGITAFFLTLGSVAAKLFADLQEFAGFIGDHMHEVLGGLAAVLVGVVIPAVVAWTAATAAAAAEMLIAAAPVIAIGALIFGLGAALVYAWDHWKTFREVIQAVIAWVRDVAAPAIERFASYVVEQFDHLVSWVKQYWPEISQVIGEVVDAVVLIFKAFFAVAAFLWSAFGDSIVNILKATWQFIRETIKNEIDFVRNLIQFFLDVLTGKWGKAWDDIKGMVSAVWREIGSVVKLGIDVIINLVTGIGKLVDKAASGLFDGLKAAFRAAINFIIDQWNGLKFTLPKIDAGPIHMGGETVGVPKIPHLATGGDVLRSGLAQVGEHGAEVVSLPAGARVYPHGTGPSSTQQIFDIKLNVTAGFGADPNKIGRVAGAALIAAIKQYELDNGKDWRNG